MTESIEMHSKRHCLIEDILKDTNLNLNTIKETSVKLLPYTHTEDMYFLIKTWEHMFTM